MKLITDIPPKEADAYSGASFKSIEGAIDILAYELNKLALIKRVMLSSGAEVFEPTDYGIEKYVPMI
jgi:hypothetical protein